MYGIDVVTIGVLSCVELILILFLIYWVPIDVDVENGIVFVKYISRKVNICNVNDVIEVKYVDQVSPKYLFCTGFGNRGFFGVAAHCMHVKNIGSCYFYSRRSRNLILLTLRDGRKYLLAPRNVESFIKKLKCT